MADNNYRNELAGHFNSVRSTFYFIPTAVFLTGFGLKLQVPVTVNLKMFNVKICQKNKTKKKRFFMFYLR